MKISNIKLSFVPTIKENTLPEKYEEKESSAVIYEKEEPIKKITYNKPKYKLDKTTIARLKADSEKSYIQLKYLVESLLRRQGKTFNQIKIGEYIPIDEEARLEAQNMIAEDGPLGVETVSDRIVDFAIAISGGDVSKLDELKSAINKGFEEAERILGRLPEISRKTYDRIMEKLDNWAETFEKEG